MIFADKIIRERKRNGWSQEELAEKMDVSRQAVSKWESAQSVPELSKILQLSKLFGVTTDYLLKDDIEVQEYISDTEEPCVRRVTLSLVNDFLIWRKTASVFIAIATFLCIFSPVPLIFLGGMSEYNGMSENFAGGLGLIILLLFISVAVAIFIYCGSKNAPYDFLDKENFETEYGVAGVVREKLNNFNPLYTRMNIIGTCICILSPVLLFCGLFIENEFLMLIMLCLMIVAAGIGVVFFIISGVRMASMKKLLKEGEFSESERKKEKVKNIISGPYWLITTAIYLCWSFLSNDWEHTWIVWPISAVLFAAMMCVCNIFLDGKDKN